MTASPSFVYACEMDLACSYALRRPQLARECAATAAIAAIRMGRPDLTYRAMDLLSALGGGQ